MPENKDIRDQTLETANLKMFELGSINTCNRGTLTDEQAHVFVPKVQLECLGPSKLKRIIVFRSSNWCQVPGTIETWLGRLVNSAAVALRVVVVGGVVPAPRGFEELPLSALHEPARRAEIFIHEMKAGFRSLGLPSTLLLQLSDLEVSDVSGFTLEGERWPYARATEDGPWVLFLFPGTIFPASMGAHRRGVTTLTALTEAGFNVTCLYTGRNRATRERVRPQLSLFAHRVESFSNARRIMSKFRVGARRYVYDRARRIARQPRALPETFIERARLRSNRSLELALKRLDLEAYDLCVVNYAWMADAILKRRPRRPRLVCDTHDVQFHRSSDGQRWTRLDRAFFDPEANRRAEIRRLRAMDHVLAISERDAELLRQVVPAEKVLVAPASFAYCFEPVRDRVAYAPLRFGFIGHRMPANLSALAVVLDEWWPKVREFSPASQLFIAGSVCSDPYCQERTFLDDSVKILGFVPSLPAYYRGIDVLLSPVTISGGVNFKNVEAIAAGVSIVTNRRGAEALRPIELSTLAETPDEVVRVLEALECEPETTIDERRRLQKEVLALFRPDEAFATIRASLDKAARE